MKGLAPSSTTRHRHPGGRDVNATPASPMLTLTAMRGMAYGAFVVAFCPALILLASRTPLPAQSPTESAESKGGSVVGPGTLLAVARLGTAGKKDPGLGYHVGPITGVALTADGRTIVSSGYYDNTIIGWAVVSRAARWQTPYSPRRLESFVVSPDGNLVAAWESLTTRKGTPNSDFFLYKTDSGKRFAHITGKGVACASFSKDGKRLASGEYDPNAGYWIVAVRDPGAEKIMESYVISGEKDLVRRVAYCGDGSHLGALTVSGQIVVLDTAMRREVYRERALHPEKNQIDQVALFGTDAGLVWLEFTRELLTRILEPGQPTNYLRLVYWDAISKKIARELKIPRVAVAGGFEPFAVSRDGKTLALGDYGGIYKKIHLFDLDTGQHLLDLKGHDGAVTALAFSRDGNLLVSGSADSTLILWDIRLARLEGLWQQLASRKESEIAFGTKSFLSPGAEALVFLRKRIEQDTQLFERVRPVAQRLDDARFDERQRALGELENRFAEFEVALRILRETEISAEARKRLDDLLPKLTPTEKELPFRESDPKRRLAELKRRYGDDYMIYPDTPGAAEFRSLSRSFEVLERIGSPEVRQFLEKLAQRPAGDWFALKAAESLKRMKK